MKGALFGAASVFFYSDIDHQSRRFWVSLLIDSRFVVRRTIPKGTETPELTRSSKSRLGRFGGKHRIHLLGLFFLFALAASSALCQTSQDCLLCHSNTSLAMQKKGRTVSLYVEEARLKNSIHASLTCVNCHTGFDPGAIPHAKSIKPVQCRNCHEIAGFEKSIHGTLQVAECKNCHGTHDTRAASDPKSSTNRANISATCAVCHQSQGKDFLTSAHGQALHAGSKAAPSCVACHGAHNIISVQSKESPLYRTNEAKVCLKCHLDNPEVRKQVGVGIGFIAAYETSVHGMALASGNSNSAICSDCHGYHDSRKALDPASHVNKRNISATCSRCHRDISKAYDESIHGTAVNQGNTDSPTCTTCHGEHQIYARTDPRSPVAPRNVSEQVCGLCHNSVPLNAKYGMPSEQFNSFSDSYHGLASKAGSVQVANCASCHGIHNIKPSADPTSTVNKANLVATCGQCHPGANRNFAVGKVHVTMTRESGSAILYWIRVFYIGLIIVVVGGMFLHNFLDFIKRTGHRLAVRYGKIVPQHYGSMLYVRMTLNARIQHAAILGSFILLVLTGFMLRFPNAWWVIPLRQLSGSFFEVRSITHRIAGAVMIAVSIYHVFYLFLTRNGRQFGADMLPRWKDVGDVWTNLRYLLAFSKDKPRFDRFGYIEKAEYWALVWGVLIMAGTGIVMWFDNYFIGLFTKLGYDISRTIHFYEACLATLAIVIWHFYYVIFNPEIWPMSTAWITGKISEEEMVNDHPLELARLKPAEPTDTPPSV